MQYTVLEKKYACASIDCLNTRTVLAAYSLSAFRSLDSLLSTERPFKTLNRLCECAGWPESKLCAHVSRYVCITYSLVLCQNYVVLESIVYNRAKVYIHQNFHTVVIYVMIIYRWNQTVRLCKIYSGAILVTVASECPVKRVICKTWTGALANSADPDQTLQNAVSDQGMHQLLKI